MKPKNFFIQNWNGILTDLIEDVYQKGHRNVTMVGDADVFVLWTDTNGWDAAVIDVAKAFGKEVIICQHGRRGSSKYYPPFNQKIMADKMLVWGKADKERLVQYGHNPKNIYVVGTTIFKKLDLLGSRKEHKGINVVFSPEHWSEEVEENTIVSKWLKELSKKIGFKVTTKTLPEHKQEKYQNPIVSDRNTEEHFKVIADVLSTADIVVGISESTFELLAEYWDIPVIIADIWKPKVNMGDERYKDYLRIYSKACTKVKTIEEMEKAIQLYLDSPTHLMKERKEICIEEGGCNFDTLKEMRKVIKY
jgi:hypothetical protein